MQRWWSNLDDECPITLEPLSDLPYPPFALTDHNDRQRRDESSPGNDTTKSCCQYFDGLALAAYVVSRSAFVNPLTRASLSYDDCVRLDTYLQEHVYSHGGGDNDHVSALVGFDGISVREAFALRDSIKVKVDRRGVLDNDQQQQRIQRLRNEAAVALRGLFIFGHDRSQRRETDAEHIPRNDQQQRRRPLNGFDLRSRPVSNLNEGGLYHFLDDDEAAMNSADYVEWSEVQEEFPCLSGVNPRQASYDSGDNDQALLETVRRTANLTLIEEGERLDRLQRARQQYFLEALERKRLRIVARESSRRDAATLVSRMKEEKSIIESARREIEEWRTAQWDEWERVAATSKIHESNVTRMADASSTCSTLEDEIIEPVHEFDSNDNDKDSKAAAKRKAKRQKAKEREKEKRRLEKLEIERKEREIAVQKAKEESNSRCGACGEGILGCGFEKYGVNFCSTTCARSGPIST
jgi:hypothetical protein